MDLYVLNRSFELIDIIDSMDSIIWAERHVGSGDFELYAIANDRIINSLQEGFYLNRIDRDVFMIIEDFNVTTDAELGNHITVTGRCLKSILSRRIVWRQTNLYGKVEMCIRRLIIENIINPTDSKRKIPNFILGDIKGFTETMEMQTSYDNLQDVIDQICRTYGFGYRVTLNEQGQLVFDLYRGVDRSYNQTENPYVVFSNDFDNLLNSDYSYQTSNYKNVVLVGGEGEGLDRKLQEVGNASGLDRYEMYDDNRHMSTNDGAITDAEYYAQMTESGHESLSEHQKVESFSGGVNYQKPYEYGVDYQLGDVVQVINEYGMAASATIAEVIESEDGEGYKSIPTFEYKGGSETWQ